MPLIIVRNDITKMSVDAIVNAAKESLLGGGGVDGCIHRAAGPELLAECRRLGGCKTGDAKITKAYLLPCRYVIHTVGPVWRGGGHGEREQLASCYRTSLALAKEHGCETVAFPLISSGVFGYPKDQALRVAVDTISEFLAENDMTVYIVIFDRKAYQISGKLFADIAEYIDDHYVAQNDETYQFDRRHREYVERWEDAVLADREYPAQECASPVFTTVLRQQSAPMAARSLENLMDNLGESFTTRLLRLIDERGLKDSTVYKQSNISRQHFSKIQCNRDYNPKKKTVLAFAVGLHLSEDETIDLLKSAGYAFSDGSKRDWIVRYCLEQKIYNINQVNTLLFEYDQEQLGA